MTEVPVLFIQIVRGLNDRVYEKRKTAALEIEKLVRDSISNNDTERVRAIVRKLVQDFTYSTNNYAKSGGLIGLAATSIALGIDVATYLDEIVPPVLSCFADQDSRVRYYACESMYNIAKVSKGEILIYFNEVFDAMSKLAADTDPSVKNGAELLDRLIKDLVAEHAITYVSSFAVHPFTTVNTTDSTPDITSIPQTTAFSLPKFIPLLSERIHVMDPFTRNFLVSWIKVLDSIPDLELVSFLPDFLNGLLQFLSDPNKDIRYATSNILANFLAEICDAATINEQQKKYAIKKYYIEQQKQLTATISEVTTTNEAGDDGLIGGGDYGDGDVSHNAISKLLLVDDNGNLKWDFDDAEGRGKGSWVPGQGVVIDYTRIVQILMPHLSSHGK
ncbi:13796_t:CDS:2 [Entrophospora sp. SA101]|nr:13796_t:CDS:2 [Entrophospora sp. SA101]